MLFIIRHAIDIDAAAIAIFIRHAIFATPAAITPLRQISQYGWPIISDTPTLIFAPLRQDDAAADH